MAEHAHGLSAHEIERIINAHVRVRVEYPSELTIVTILGKDTAASLIAAALSRSSGQNLADAHSKSPDPTPSQSERIAALEAALRFYACDPETCDCRPGEEQSDRVLCGYRARAALPQEPAAPLGEAGR